MKVDRYVEDLLIPPDPILDAAQKASAAAGLPDIAVTPSQGKFLHLLARMQQARRILEIGTLGGYSTIWLARALPPTAASSPSKPIPPTSASPATISPAPASPILSNSVSDLRWTSCPSSPAPSTSSSSTPTKRTPPPISNRSLRLSRPGTAIVVDNVVRGGAVASPRAHDTSSRGIHEMNEAIRGNPRVTATVLQTVGRKGYDGFMLALVTQ